MRLKLKKMLRRHRERERRSDKRCIMMARPGMARIVAIEVRRVFWVNAPFKMLWTRMVPTRKFDKKTGKYGWKTGPVRKRIFHGKDIIQPVVLSR